MKTPFKIVLSLTILAFSFSCSKDDDDDTAVLPEPVEAVEPVDVSFTGDKSFTENSASNEIRIEFSKAAVQSGKIVVRTNGNPDGFFNTVPALINNEIELSVNEGDRSVVFSFEPVNNAELNGHHAITFELKSVSDGFAISSLNDIQIELLDDELMGKPKSWETGTGIWRMKKTLEYDTQGKISKVNWENENPGFSSGTDTYFYNDEEQIIRINYSANVDKHFYWENGKIIRSEQIEQGVKKRYEEYTYNAAGAIQSVTFYTLNLIGQYTGSTQVFEYSTDGNLNKQIWYSTTDVNGYIYSRRTFDAYIDKSNPFPMVDLLPNIKMQITLPGHVLIQENAMDLNYNFTYEFDAEGRVSRRITNGETTVYTYY